MSAHDGSDDEWAPVPGTGALGADGERVGGPGPAPAPPASSEGPRSFLEDDRPLELEQDPQQIIQEREAAAAEEAPPAFGDPSPRSRSSGAVAAVIVVALLAVAGVTYLLVPNVRSAVDLRLPRSGKPMLKIDSVPSGATVWIEGKQVGETPLFQDNVYPDAEISVVIAHPGYERWRGTFRGGEEQAVEATLKRSGPGKRR